MMQPVLSMVPQDPAMAMLLPLPMAAAPVLGKAAGPLTEFGDELAKAMAAATPEPDTMLPVPEPTPASTQASEGAPSATPAKAEPPVPLPVLLPGVPMPAHPVPPPAGVTRDTPIPSPRRSATPRVAAEEAGAAMASALPVATPAAPDVPVPATAAPVEVVAAAPEAPAGEAAESLAPAPVQHAHAAPPAEPRPPPGADAAPAAAELPHSLVRHEAPPTASLPSTPPAETPARAVAAPVEPASPSTVPAEKTTAPAAPIPHPPTPAAQVAPAVIRIARSADGTQRLTVRLDPPELGHVQVRIERPTETPPRIEIIVEKPETLNLLLRDQPQLQRALDQAGVPAEGRSVTFHIAATDPPARQETALTPAADVAAGGLSGDGTHGAPRQGGQQARQRTDEQELADGDFVPIALSGWMRGGLDITA